MQKFTLKNGLKVLYQKTNSNSATVNVLVKTGSNNESNGISGISHFIEHMLFEGTKKRPNSRLIANEIEKLGGIFNAYTSGEVTCYYAKVMNKDIEKAFEILSDIILNPLFENKIIGKERKVIMKELHMVIDDPRFYQWRLFQKELFKGHPAANPTLGTSASLKSMSREKILNYYRKFYSADKMVISVAGNIDGVNSMAEKYFLGMKPNNSKLPSHSGPPKQFLSVKIEKRKILSSYWVIGYKTPSRSSRESYALDTIAAMLGRGQSGKLFDEIRNKNGLAYEVGVNHEPSKEHGYFAVYASTDKANVEKGRNIALNVINEVKKTTERDLEDAKTYIEGRHAIEMDETEKFADKLAYWEFASRAEDALEYIDKIKNVTLADIRNVATKYLNKEYTMVVLEPK